MSESPFSIKFIRGSRDGENVEGSSAPSFVNVFVSDRIKEIYKRMNDESPFVYEHIGYAKNKRWK